MSGADDLARYVHQLLAFGMTHEGLEPAERARLAVEAGLMTAKEAARILAFAKTTADMLAHARGSAQWPRLMRAATAAAYVDERSEQSFRRSVGKLWPRPIRIDGKGERWLRDELDAAISGLKTTPGEVVDAADVL